MKRSSLPSQPRWFRRLRNPRSLQRQIMGLLGLTYLVTLVLILAVVVASVNRAEVAAWRTRQAEAAHSAGETVSNFLQRNVDMLNLISLLGRDELLAEPTMMSQLLGYNPALLEIVGLDATGKVFVSGYQDRAVLANLFTIPQSQWFSSAKAGKPYYGGVRVSASDKPYLIIALPAFDGGVIAARLSMDVLWNVVANIRFGESGRAYVVDQDGAVIAHTDPGVVLAQTTLADRPEILTVLNSPDKQRFGEYRNFDGADVVGVTSPIGSTDWIVVTELPQAEAYQYSRNAIVLIGGTLLIISTAMVWLLRHNLKRLIFQPMKQLQVGAERIGQGNLNYRIGLTRQDEIGQVAQAFDEMAERLQGRDTQLATQAAALRDNEARYRAIVEDQTELICRWQPAGTLTFVNEAYCRYFNRARDELIGNSFMPLIPEEDRSIIEHATGQFSPDHAVATYEHRVILPDGSLHWQQWTDRALYDEHGEIVEFASVGRDITERRLAEEALRDSEARLRMALHASRMLAWDFDPQTRTLLLSDNAVEIWGSPISGLEDTLNVLHPGDKPGMLNFWASALAQGGEHLAQFRVVQPTTGAIRWMEARGRVQRDAADTIRLGGVIFDISERKQAEEEIRSLNANLEQRVIDRTLQLRQAEAKYRVLVEQIPAVTYIDAYDEFGSTVYMSPQCVTMLGYTPAEWGADPQLWPNILHPDDRERVLAEHRRTNASGELFRIEYRMFARDGRVVWVYDEARLILDEVAGTHYWQGMMYDITDRKYAEDQIHASLREKEVLLKEIHHRVKNNLQVISSLLSLQSSHVQDLATLEILRESQHRVRSMALIHEKLYQSDDLARVDFAEYVRNLATYLFRSYKASPAAISLSIETAPDLRLSLDAAIPCGLIINELVSNALKHAFPDGRAGEICIAFGHAADGQYSLRISDSGVGIPDGLDFRQSTSLGLQLVNTLIEQLDGTIEMRRNGGTEFVARFSDVKR